MVDNRPRCKAKVVGENIGGLVQCKRRMKHGTRSRYCHQHRYLEKKEIGKFVEGDMIHAVQFAPGTYIVSHQFAEALKKEARLGESIGMIGGTTGVEIRVSALLPYEYHEPKDRGVADMKVVERVVVHKASGGYPHPTLCGQYISFGFNAAESDDEVTCTKCLNRMAES